MGEPEAPLWADKTKGGGVNLGTAILRAHKKGDESRRNYLIGVALANGASYRQIARLLQKSLHTIWRWAPEVERRDPLKLPVSTFDSERSAA